MFRKLRTQGPWLVVSAIVFGLLASSFAMASGEGTNLILGKRNPGSNASATLTSETQIIANNSTYGTRQSNKSDSGGGAIYGCRSKLGGTEKGNQPCVRASNLADGRAFEFSSNGGTEVGQITSTNGNAAPFITNAHGVATGLNADQVDGKNAADITTEATKAAHDDAVATAQGLTSFAAVAADGTLGAKRGATASARTTAGSGTYTVTFANDISACAIQVTESTITDAGAAAAALGDDKKTVTVRTRAGGGAGGTPTTDPADRPFNITVTC